MTSRNPLGQNSVLFVMPARGYKALMMSVALYALVSPLATWNTFALLGLAHSLLPLLQLAITVPMIVLAIIAGQSIGKHCLANDQCNRVSRVFWTIGFYVIGPPALYLYYRRHYRTV